MSTKDVVCAVTLTVPYRDLTAEIIFSLIADPDLQQPKVVDVDDTAVVAAVIPDDQVEAFAAKVDELAELLGFDTQSSTTYTLKQWEKLV